MIIVLIKKWSLKMADEMTNQLTAQDVMDYTAEIVAAYLSNNEVSQDEIPDILKRIFHSVASILRDSSNLRNRPAQTPAVPIEDSVHDDYIICLEDGKKLQMLKRHLSTVYNLTVDQYKERWGLPADYPVTAPNYSKKRGEIAKTAGLGNTGRRKLKVA